MGSNREKSNIAIATKIISYFRDKNNVFVDPKVGEKSFTLFFLVKSVLVHLERPILSFYKNILAGSSKSSWVLKHNGRGKFISK